MQHLRAVPIFLGALHFRLRRIHGGLRVQLLLRARAVLQLGEPRLVGRQMSARRCSMSAASVSFCHSSEVFACAELRFRRLQPGDFALALGDAIGRGPGARSIWPFLTLSPSSTVRSISLPAVLKAMLTSVSSMLPETMMRFSGVLIGAAIGIDAAAPATATRSG